VSASVAGRTVDNTAPTTSLDTPPGGIYLNANAPDPFGLTASTPDIDVAQVEFFACDDASAGCATGSWVSVGTDTSAPYGVSWPLPAADGVEALKAVATDHAGNSASSVVTVTIDRDAPSGGSVTYTNGYGATPVTIAVANGSDDVSGIDAASALLERDETTLANGSCGSFAGNWTTVTTPDSSVASGHCYRYRYTVADNAGNPGTYTTSDVLKVDGSAPTVALDAGPANLRGTASLSATASDALSGIASVAFQRSPAGAAAWTTISADTSAPFAASFDTTSVADGLYDLRAVATDGSGATAADGTSRRVDNTLPSGSLTAPADGAVLYGSVPVSSNSADGGSAVGSVAFESSPAGAGSWSSIGSDSSAPYSVSFDTTSLAEGVYDLRAVTTDVAGNTFTSPLRTVTIDNTLLAPTLAFGSFTNAAVSGSTVYFRPGSSGGFTVTAQPNGVATTDHVDFDNLGSGWTGGGTDASVPYEGSYSFDGSAVEPGAGRQVVVVDNAARPSPAATFAVLADETAPTTTVACSGASCSSDWYSAAVSVSLSATDPASGLSEIHYTTDGSDPTPLNGTVYTGAIAVASTTTVRYRAYDRVGNAEAVHSQLIRIDTAAPTVSLGNPGNELSGNVALAATAGDSGSGIASVSFERSPAGAGTWTTIGTDTSSPYTANLDASTLADGLYDLRAIATDVAGNTTTSALVTSRVDATPPSISLDDLDPAVHGIVGLSADSSDAGSGISSVFFEYSPAGNDDWTTTPAAWNTTTLDDGSYDLRAGANDAAGNSAYSAVVTMLIDNTAPAALMDDPGSPLDGTITLTSHSSDALAGIASEVFQYSPAGMDSWTSLGGTSWDTSSVPQGRYDLRVVAMDAAGNVSASDPVLNRAVSNSGIAVTIISPGNIVAGADADPASIQASSPDAADLLSIQFFACDNQSVSCATGNWVSLGSDTTDPYTAFWTIPADGNRALRAVATSTSHVQGTEVLNTLVDRTAPSGGSISYAGGYSTGPVTITGDPGTDAGSGVDLGSALIERDEGTLAGGSCSFTGSWQAVSSPDSALASGHCYRYRYGIADVAGNTRFYTSATEVKSDTGTPTVSLDDPGASLHGTANLGATAADSESGVASVQFQRSPAGAASWTTISTDTSAPFSASFDTTTVADGLYDLRAVATDAAGNQALSALATDQRVDNSAPDLTFTGPADGDRVWGSLPLAASATDSGTGLAWVKFRSRTAAGAWTTWATQTTAPFAYTWDSTSVVDGAAQIQVLASDALGNESSVTRSVIVDNDAPTVTLDTVPPLASGSLPLTASASADTMSVLFQIRLSGGSWTDLATDVTAPYSAVVNTTTLTDGHYDFRAVAIDAAGHTASGIAANVLVDNTAPTGSITAPGTGTAVSSTTVHLAVSASDAGSGLASVTFQQRTLSGSWSDVATDATAPYESDWNRTGFTDGVYQVRAVLLDALGNSFATAAAEVTLVSGTPPPPPPPPTPVPFTFGAAKVSFVVPRGSSLVFLSLTLQLSREAKVQTSLLKGKKTTRKWLNKISTGKRVLKLGIPKKLLKKGAYTLVLTATTADGSSVQRKLVVRVPAKFKAAKKR
jgi:large repetitive protein